MKIKKFGLVIAAIFMVVSLTACAGEPNGNPESNNNESQTSEPVAKEETTETEENTSAESKETPVESVQSGAIDEKRAREMFAEAYPGIAIQVFKLEDGNGAYYMQSIEGGYKYIMKVKIYDGRILVSKKIKVGH